MKWMKQNFLIGILLAGALFSLGCQKETMKTEPLTSTEWDSFVADLRESYLVANLTFGVSAGGHEFDGILPDWSPGV